MPDDPRVVDSTGALLLQAHPEADAGDRRRHHRPRDGDRLFDARHAHRRRRDARRPDAGRRPRPRQGVGEDERAALRQRHAEDEDGRRRRRRKAGIEVSFEGEKAPAGAAALRPRAGRRRPQPERQEDRRRQGRRRRHRARLHRRRQADAHQRAAHLRDRRHRRPADARAQGGARGARRGRGRARREVVLRCAADSVGRLHRSRGRLGRPDRGAVQGRGHQVRQGGVPVGRVGPRDRQRPRRRLHQAAVRRGDASRASAAASSARTPAT